MTDAKPFGWAVIGAGRIADTVASEIVKSGRHKIVSVYSRTLARAQKFADKFGAKAFDTLDEALFCGGVEGVYIATPHSAHYFYIIECVKRKIPVLCEKAFTVNEAQAQAALTAAKASGIYVAEAMWTRFNPVVRQICEWVQDGEIGEIKSISANFCLPLALAKPFVSERVYKPEYAGGALLDLGVYPIAYSHMLLGAPERITCRSTLKNGADYDDKITLFYKNAVCNLNCSFDRLLTYKSVIEGTRGRIVSPMFYKPHAATLINQSGRKSVKCKKGYIYQFDAVAADIRNGKTENSLISHKDTLEIMRVMDECRKQAGLKYPENIEKI